MRENKPMELTGENYYSPEADRDYMSCSQYQDFLRCEAAAMAKIHGLYTPEPTEALIVGNYFHTALESEEAHQRFCAENEAYIYKTKTDKKTGEVTVTGKYSAYEKADEMLDCVRSDPMFRKLLDAHGESEKIVTGKLFGFYWKCAMDKYIPESRTIIDWKTAQDLSKTEYNPKTGERETFLSTLGYLMRAAVYTELEKQYTGSEEDAKFIIGAVSKQDPPDKGLFLLNHRQRYDWELEEVGKNMRRIFDVKTGRTKARRCGRCEYCRATKRLSRIVHYYTLDPGFQEEREEEYDDIYSHYMEEAQKTPVCE